MWHLYSRTFPLPMNYAEIYTIKNVVPWWIFSLLSVIFFKMFMENIIILSGNVGNALIPVVLFGLDQWKCTATWILPGIRISHWKCTVDPVLLRHLLFTTTFTSDTSHCKPTCHLRPCFYIIIDDLSKQVLLYFFYCFTCTTLSSSTSHNLFKDSVWILIIYCDIILYNNNCEWLYEENSMFYSVQCNLWRKT